MTLGIAVRTPWGKGREYEAQLTGRFTFAPAVVLVADSRFSNNGIPVRDSGAKLWALSPGVIAALAGRVAHAQLGLNRTKQRLRNTAPASVRQAAAVISEAMRDAVPHHARRSRNHRCWLLIGVSSLDGDAAIVRLDSATDFKPAISIEDQFIGQEQLKEAVYERLRTETRLAFADDSSAEGKDVVTRPSDMAVLAAVLDDIARAKLNDSVGGRPQVAYVQHGRTFPIGAWALNPRTGVFEKRTAGYDEVSTDGQRLNSRRLAGFSRKPGGHIASAEGSSPSSSPSGASP